jgi:D-3-phosphoglycerate dehydrogenase
MKVIISATPFAQFSEAPLQSLRQNGFEPVISPFGSHATEQQSIDLLKQAVGVIAGLEPLTRRVMTACPSVRVISRVGIGLDNVDLVAARELGVAVLNTPDAPTQAVAELTLGHILNALRQTCLSTVQMKQGVWQPQPARLLAHKTVGVVGLGRIGRRLIELMKPFHVNVLAFDKILPADFIEKNKIRVCASVAEMLPQCDIITLHIPFTAESKHIIGLPELKSMRSDAYLINCSRGGLIDETALQTILSEGHLAGVALDCFETEPYKGPLSACDRVILTPHVGSYTQESRILMETLAVDNFLASFSESSKCTA